MPAPAPSQILLVEDEQRIAEFIRRGLALEGYAPRVVSSGEDGVAALRRLPIDLVLLDLMLPGADGIDICRMMRSFSDVPIIALTARDGIEARVAGLEAGADDYIVKPFAFVEVVARIRATLRRRPANSAECIRTGDLEVNPLSRTVTRGGRSISLSKREFDLLELLARNAGQVLTREVIQERVWGVDSVSAADPVKVYISYLRSKLNANGEPDLIRSVRGLGYSLEGTDA